MASTASLGLRLVPVTAAFTVPFAITGSLLALSVALTRVSLNVFQGEKVTDKDGKPGATIKSPDGREYDALLISNRIHGNYVENVPITLFVAAMAEISGADKTRLAYTLGLFYIMRVAHMIGLQYNVLPGRAFGFFGSNALQVALSSWLFVLTKGHWGL